MLVTIDFESFYDKKLKYDIKSMGLVKYIRDPQFYVQGMGIKIDAAASGWVTGKNVKETLARINWDEATLVGHNLKFDGSILAWKYGVQPKRYADTLGLSLALINNRIPSCSLKSVAEYFDLPPKGELNTNGKKYLTSAEEKELATYCIRDVDISYQIYQKLSKDFPECQWDLLDWSVRTFINPQLVIDGEKCKETYEASVANKKKILEDIGIDGKIFRSNPKFKALLESFGVKVPMKKNKDGNMIPAFSIGDSGFMRLLRGDNLRVKKLCETRVIVKQTLEETRAKKLWEMAGISKYCFDMIFSGAKQTHRLSGGSGCGGNPHNFGKESALREALTVGEGKALVVADLAGIELRILAYLSQDVTLIQHIKDQDINPDDKVYCKMASRIYGEPVTKESNLKAYNVGKAAVLGLGYGMGAKRFKNEVYVKTGQTISLGFAKEIVTLYRETYPGVKKFWNTCETILEQMIEFPDGIGVPFLGIEKEAIVLPLGLKMMYPNLRWEWVDFFGKRVKEWKYDRYENKSTKIVVTKTWGGTICENICQGVAGDICKEAIKRLLAKGYMPQGAVHDEALQVCEEADVEKTKKDMSEAMTSPLDWWKDLPLGVSVNSGTNWLQAK